MKSREAGFASQDITGQDQTEQDQLKNALTLVGVTPKVLDRVMGENLQKKLNLQRERLKIYLAVMPKSLFIDEEDVRH
jgi:hypothetical protein